MLHDFLEANRATIVARTRSKVAARQAPRATQAELENGIPLFLDQLIEILAPSRSASDTLGVDDEGAATKHGRDLWRKGFTVAQVVHDYGGLCQAVTELAKETEASITAEEFQTFNGCLDDAIAAAVTEFTRQREESISNTNQEHLGEIAHELRNALGSAMIAFEVLRKGTVGVRGSTASVLANSLRRLSSLIDSSLAEVRLASGIRAQERVSLREFIEEVEVGASMEANVREITLTVKSAPPGIDMNVDRQLLAAAVGNLLVNAFKFTRSKGHVSLTASSTNDRVLIEVEDECGGLPPGKVEGLFRPFEQRSADRTGLGLGLSITRKSVEANGGTVRVRDIPGTGCVFTIDLPRLAPRA